MSNLGFQWDARKAASNESKHGVTLEDARTVFADEHARLIDDPDHSDEEDRIVLLGMSAGLRLLIVVHCYRAEDNVIRIISARRATRSEARFYP